MAATNLNQGKPAYIHNTSINLRLNQQAKTGSTGLRKDSLPPKEKGEDGRYCNRRA